MAAVETATPDTPLPETSPSKVEKLTKVEKPDDEKFKKDLAEAEKRLAAVTGKMVPLEEDWS
jgi:hypothetical protein